MSAEHTQYLDLQKKSQTEIKLFQLQRDIRIIPDSSALATQPETFGMKTIEIDILPRGLVLAVSDRFIVNDPPTYHHDEKGNKTSEAGYYIDEHEELDEYELLNKQNKPDEPNTPKHIVYLSKIYPHSTTSRHKHPHPMREFYFLLYGEAFQGEEPMKPRSVINPFEYHQVTTRERPALLLIFMENGATIPKHLRHQK